MMLMVRKAAHMVHDLPATTAGAAVTSGHSRTPVCPMPAIRGRHGTREQHGYTLRMRELTDRGRRRALKAACVPPSGTLDILELRNAIASLT